MLLERLRIQGFQSHVDTDLEFDAKSNVVKGDNASGKSAIRRAMLWVLTNKPSGTAFINWGFTDSQPCTVSIWYDGHCVTRRRSRDGKVNEYVVDGEVLTAFGVGLPPVVASIFKLDDTNIELQHSALFMLSESAPDMARRLNKLTNLESIDTAYGSLRKRKLDTGRKLKDAQERHVVLEKELEKYVFLDDAELVVELLENALAEVVEYQGTWQGAGALASDLSQSISRIHTHAEVKVDELVSTCAEFAERQRVVQDVDRTLDAVHTLIIREHAPFSPSTTTELKAGVQDAYSEWEAVGTLATSILKVLDIKYPPIHAKDIDIQSMRDSIAVFEDVRNMVDDFKKLSVNIESAKDMRNTMKVEYDSIMPSTCPLCGSITHEGRCV